jgi:hypothetical protein
MPLYLVLLPLPLLMWHLQVAYMDPGNWATAIEAGSRFGYQLVSCPCFEQHTAPEQPSSNRLPAEAAAAAAGLAQAPNAHVLCHSSRNSLVCQTVAPGGLRQGSSCTPLLSWQQRISNAHMPAEWLAVVTLSNMQQSTR